MNKYLKISLIIISIVLFFIILFVIYKLYFFTQGINGDIEHRNKVAESFLLGHPLKGIIVAMRYDQSNKQKSDVYTIQLVDYDSTFIPCINKYIGSCDNLNGSYKIYFSQKSYPSRVFELGRQSVNLKASWSFMLVNKFLGSNLLLICHVNNVQ